MPDINTQIVHYQYEFRALPGENLALLTLFNPKGKAVAMLVFVDGSNPLPEPRETPGGLVIQSYYRRDLAGIIDMLRNEKPVHFTWASAARLARVTTEQEPVGEEEFRGFWARVLG
ncbi:hypothetical protein [Geoalkalibacter halelectricus]|uniref:Uncharacterized protein n=1 Tax=Geoalkalibacter halelectricus TaxID=2847045 RepID=A0ABY5ZJ32_9BACT|nr:hypothetical protein [Geoalkalibacter halelectricus]MDO3378269.1 hypothetical protein [Geoalkalibacter halelectricus]UWZ79140.1 hypothetical protein L9S41_15860 [Geoalkalibacter halelectricus]